MLRVYKYMALGLPTTGLVTAVVGTTPALYTPLFSMPLAILAPLLVVYGYHNRHDLYAIDSFLIMGLIGILIASIANIFLGSSALQFMLSVVGIIVFLRLTAWDTQSRRSSTPRISILNRSRSWPSSAHSLLLLNFVGEQKA
jgi:FtsH-binding integral membrane protein